LIYEFVASFRYDLHANPYRRLAEFPRRIASNERVMSWRRSVRRTCNRRLTLAAAFRADSHTFHPAGVAQTAQ